jgi:hypothetical protein
MLRAKADLSSHSLERRRMMAIAMDVWITLYFKNYSELHKGYDAFD